MLLAAGLLPGADSPQVVSALGWSLIHALWQGTAVAALAALAMTACRSASARYGLAMAALSASVLAPMVTFFWLLGSGTPPALTSLQTAITTPVAAALEATPAAAMPTSPVAPVEPLPWLVTCWLVGVAAFGLRAAGGLWLVDRLGRRPATSVPEEILALGRTLEAQLGIARAVRYRACSWLGAPAVVGWLRPVVFLPITAFTGLTPGQLRLVIAHELAHIRRWDGLANLLQVASETLLFYHPAVWWLNRRIRSEREHCCDDLALSLGNGYLDGDSLRCDRVDYARALAEMAAWRRPPRLALGANSGPLAGRVRRILGLGPERPGGRCAGILCLVLALFVGHSLAQPVVSSPVAKASAPPTEGAAPSAAIIEAPPPQRSAEAAPRAERPRRAEEATPRPGLRQDRPAPATPDPYGTVASELARFTADQRATFETHGITGAEIRALRQAGVSPSFGELIAFKIHGVTPSYVRQMGAVLTVLDEAQLIAMGSQGIDPGYARALAATGLELQGEQLVALKVHDVQPRWVADLASLGLEPDAAGLVALKVHGIEVASLARWLDLGLEVDVSAALALEIHDVRADEVAALRGLGFGTTVEEFIALRQHGVTVAEVRRARARGVAPRATAMIALRQAGRLEGRS